MDDWGDWEVGAEDSIVVLKFTQDHDGRPFIVELDPIEAVRMAHALNTAVNEAMEVSE